MEQINIPLGELESLFGYLTIATDDLVEKVQEHGWEGIVPIPVVEVPIEHRLGGKKYFHMDGNHRHDAARKTGSRIIPGLKYDSNDDPKEVSKLTGNALLKDYDTVINDMLLLREIYFASTGKTKQELEQGL